MAEQTPRRGERRGRLLSIVPGHRPGTQVRHATATASAAGSVGTASGGLLVRGEGRERRAAPRRGPRVAGSRCILCRGVGTAACRGPAGRAGERARVRVRDRGSGQATEDGLAGRRDGVPLRGGPLLQRRLRRRAGRRDLPGARAGDQPRARAGAREDRDDPREGAPAKEARRGLRLRGAAPGARRTGAATAPRDRAAHRGRRRGRKGDRSAPAAAPSRAGRRGRAHEARDPVRQSEPLP